MEGGGGAAAGKTERETDIADSLFIMLMLCMYQRVCFWSVVLVCMQVCV